MTVEEAARERMDNEVIARRCQYLLKRSPRPSELDTSSSSEMSPVSSVVSCNAIHVAGLDAVQL